MLRILSAAAIIVIGIIGAALAAACGSSDAGVDLVHDAASASAAPAERQVGSNVGDKIADFRLTLGDGSAVASADLIAQDRPAMLFFFATT